MARKTLLKGNTEMSHPNPAREGKSEETDHSESRMIRIFDTTLRDGEQSPGASMNLAEKLEVAQLLADMGVDIIEAGFPIASPGDFEAVKQIEEDTLKTIKATKTFAMVHCIGNSMTAGRERLGQVLIIMANGRPCITKSKKLLLQ